MTRTHFGQHGDECFGCKVQTISIAPHTHAISMKDRAWEKDMAAYARLRRDGLQPPGIDGSALLEQRATTDQEVTAGQVLTTKRQQRQLASLNADLGA
jgi:hypothetical protein